MAELRPWCIARARDSDRRRRDRIRPRCRTRSGCTCPCGHAIVRSRILSVKADFGNRRAVVRLPGFADDLAAPAEHVVDERAVDVPAIDQQVVDGESLPRHVDRQGRHGLLLGPIRGRDGARQDQAAIDVRGDVPLEAIEPLALALPAVTHLLVLDRHPSICGDPVANARRRRPADRAPDPACGSARGSRPASFSGGCRRFPRAVGARSTPARRRVDARTSCIASAFSPASFQSMSSARLILDSRSRGMPACVHTCSSVHPSRPAAHRTTLRAAWASRLNVSSTRPAPSNGLESIATRRVLGSLR